MWVADNIVWAHVKKSSVVATDTTAFDIVGDTALIVLSCYGQIHPDIDNILLLIFWFIEANIENEINVLQLQNKANDKFYELFLVFWQYCGERERQIWEREIGTYIHRDRENFRDIRELREMMWEAEEINRWDGGGWSDRAKSEKRTTEEVGVREKRDSSQPRFANRDCAIGELWILLSFL